MLSMSRCLRSARLSTFLCGSVLAALCAAPAAAVPSLECALNDSLDNKKALQHKRLQVQQAGYLLVEVQGQREGAGWFDLAEGCDTKPTARVVEHGFDHGILWVEPGALELRYGTVHPAASESLDLSIQWIHRFGTKDEDGDDEGDDTETGTAEIVPNQQGLGHWPWPNKDGDGDDDEGDDTETGTAEIVPNQQGFDSWPWPTKDGDDDEGDDTETGTAEIVPNRNMIGVDGWQGCLDGSEPFNDFALCASPLMAGEAVDGFLEARQVGDRDYYTLTLERATRVHLSLQGDGVAHASLLLMDGRPLRHLSSALRESKAVETLDALLPSGDYLVRVEGVGHSTGAYRLELR